MNNCWRMEEKVSMTEDSLELCSISYLYSETLVVRQSLIMTSSPTRQVQNTANVQQ
jgi:hypothetical protein